MIDEEEGELEEDKEEEEGQEDQEEQVEGQEEQDNDDEHLYRKLIEDEFSDSDKISLYFVDSVFKFFINISFTDVLISSN